MTQAKLVTTKDQPRITPTEGTPRAHTRCPGDYRGKVIDAVAAAIARDARRGVDSPGPFIGVNDFVEKDRDSLEQFDVSLSDFYPFFRTGGMFESRSGVRSLKRERERQLERERAARRAARRAAFEAHVERESGDDVETSDDSDDSHTVDVTTATVTPVGEDEGREVRIRSHPDVPVGDVDESADDDPVEGDPGYDHCAPGKYNIETCRCCVCPACGNRSIYYRKSLSPDYRCRTQTCKHEFDHPASA